MSDPFDRLKTALGCDTTDGGTDIALSPDDNWLACSTSESGRYEIVVRPFPDLQSGRHQISVSGGTSPLWAHTGRELFYILEEVKELVGRSR